MVIDTDPDFYHSVDMSYDKQLDVARKILPSRIAEYEKLMGRKLESILEIGCATGAYARAFDELNIRYMGVEIESELAQKTAKRTGLNIINADFLDLSFDNDFDVFFYSQVLEHVPNPSKFLNRAREITPNGLVHVDVPNHDALTSNIRKIYHKNDYGFIQPPYHMIAYNGKSLTKLYERCGISMIHCRPFSNDHRLWGQLVPSPSTSQKIVYQASNMINAGSLLSAIGKSNLN